MKKVIISLITVGVSGNLFGMGVFQNEQSNNESRALNKKEIITVSQGTENREENKISELTKREENNIEKPLNGNTPLHFACRNGKKKLKKI